MTKPKKITGIILSGGKSSRMGSEKGLVKYKGKALIEYSIDTLRSVCEDLVISSGNDCYSYLGIPIVRDELEDCGPIGGIYSCMKAIPSDIYFVISCDVPHVTPQLYTDLLVVLNQNQAVIPVDDQEKYQPLVACYSSSCLPVFELELRAGRLKMMKLLLKLKVHYHKIPPKIFSNSSNLFFNANTPDDIEK
ncbi:molybdenum cofactor guanylyltransferase [Labilibaculum sp.]|uniref:molybdenum cofactor guanylyltransferase n=1 Tax=Labilibaculum sp. TaxID=2060723 RepID=UPI0035684B76